MLIRRLLVCATLGVLLAACGDPAPPLATSARGLPLGDLHIRHDGKVLVTLEVEIADDAQSRSRGLMRVERLDETNGMVFLSTTPSRGAFFMKNTLIPLDIAFWDEAGRIVDIQQMQPCRADPCPLYQPSTDYVGAVEVNLGLMDRRGVRVGDVATLRRRSKEPTG